MFSKQYFIMQKKLFILLLLLLSNLKSFSQTDTLFYKNGKVSVGFYLLSADQKSVLLKNNFSIEIPATELQGFATKGKYYFPVEWYIDGMKRIFLAERVLRTEEIDLLELTIRTKLNQYTEPVLIRKYFLARNGKSTLINDANLSSFYKIYFSDCYDEKKNKNLEYNYNSIIDVLNRYTRCKNPKKYVETIQKQKYITGKKIGFSIDMSPAKHVLLHGYGPSPNYIFYYKNAKMYDRGLGISFFTKLDLTKNNQVEFAISANNGHVTADTFKITQWDNNYKIDYTFQSAYILISLGHKIKLGKGNILLGGGLKVGRMFNFKDTFTANSNYLKTTLTAEPQYIFPGIFGKIDYNFPIGNKVDILVNCRIGYSGSLIDSGSQQGNYDIYGLEHIGLGLSYKL
jgi:hypothetical protein